MGKLEDLTRYADMCRSSMHYYKKNKDRSDLDNAKYESAKAEMERLKIEIKKTRYEMQTEIFLDRHPELIYLFKDKK